MKKYFFICFVLLTMSMICSCSKDEEGMYIKVPQGEVNYLGSKIDFDPDGGTKTFAFVTNRDWSITIADTRSGIDWLNVSAKSGSAGEHRIDLDVSKNETYDDRSVVVNLIIGDSITKIIVNQKQLDAMTLTADLFELPVDGGSFEVEVKSNIDYKVEIPDEFNWIHLGQQNQTRALVTSRLAFTVDASEEYAKREGLVYIISGDKKETIHVFQTGSEILTLSRNEIYLSSKEQNVSLFVNSNFDYAIEMPSVDWISEVSTRSMSSHIINLLVAENTSFEQREASIRFFDKNSAKEDFVKIVQSAKGYLEITSAKEYTVFEDGQDIAVTLKASNSLIVEAGATWIKSIETRSVSESSLAFKVTAKNDLQNSRKSFIAFTDTINGLSDTVKVTQVRSILFAKTTMELMAEATAEIEFTQNIGGKLTWTSSNTNVASVDQDGKVTAIAKGTTIITAMAEDGKHKATCNVTVKDITDYINAYCSGGSVFITNDLLQYGSSLGFVFRNNSTDTVTLESMQLIDGKTGSAGNLMTIGKEVQPNTSVSYSVSIGMAGIHLPITNRMTFSFKGKEYFIDVKYDR